MLFAVVYFPAHRVRGEGREEGGRPPGELHGHQRHGARWVDRVAPAAILSLLASLLELDCPTTDLAAVIFHFICKL